MSIARTRTALLRTSAATDVKSSGAEISITGLDSIFGKNILKISHYRYRAEVVKVETIGGTAPTPLASTRYIVEISDNTSKREGHSNAIVPKKYSYKTPADLTEIGSTAALQREYIYGKIITDINNDTANNVVAVSLTGGAGFTITDDSGYYPAKTAGGQNPREGKTTIFLPKDENGRGFVDSTHRVLTTDATYQFGEGTRLAQDAPVVYALGGSNVVAGTIDCPLTVDQLPPLAGQKYDAFGIQHLVLSEVPTIGEVKGYRVAQSMIFVDNGLGTVTTNRAGFLAFERQIIKLMIAYLYKNDPKTVVEFFDLPPVFSTVGAGGAAIGTNASSNKINTSYGALREYIIGTSTAIVPTPGDTGWNLDLDATDTEGLQIAPDLGALCDQKFTVGKDEFSLIAKVVAADWTDVYLKIGFRKKAAFTADFNDYTDLAAVGTDSTGDDFYTHGILNNAATVSTDTGVNGTDGTASEFRIKVAIDGTVSCYIDNVKYPIYSAGTTALVFDAGDEMVPFVEATNVGGGDPDAVISMFVAIADANWKVDA